MSKAVRPWLLAITLMHDMTDTIVPMETLRL